MDGVFHSNHNIRTKEIIFPTQESVRNTKVIKIAKRKYDIAFLFSQRIKKTKKKTKKNKQILKSRHVRSQDIKAREKKRDREERRKGKGRFISISIYIYISIYLSISIYLYI